MNDLITQASKDLLPASKSQTQLDTMLAADVHAYLPYMQMMQKQSKLTSPPHNISPGAFVLIQNKEPDALSDEVDVMLLEKRPLAWKYGPADNIRIYDMDDPIFQEIQEMARHSREKLEELGDTNTYSWGGEFLIYLPHKETCATFFAGTPSMRQAAAKDFNHLVEERALITWKSRWLDPEKSKFAWYVMDTLPCNTADQYEAPDMEVLGREIEKFQNPDVVETVAKDESEEQ